jgi:hypothetical protein
VTADQSGNITDSFNLPDAFVSDYDVTATGAQSGVATSSFTDAFQVTNKLESSKNPSAVAGDSVQFTSTITWTKTEGGHTVGQAVTEGSVQFK